MRLALLLLFAGACSVSHRSDGIATCERSSDCAGNQVCSAGGICVAASAIDANEIDAPGIDAGRACPSQCTSCRPDRNECRVDCAISPATCNAPIVCPPGMNCVVSCSTPSSCQQGITCGTANRCNVTCSGANSCRNLTCGDGPCNVTCTGLRSCRNVHCGDSCACDVACDQGTCDQGLECSGLQCVKLGSPFGCTSSNPTCNSCP